MDAGGQSSLYGVEGPAFYLRNGANQLQLVLPLALGLPLLMAAAWAPTAAFSLQQVAGQAAGGQRSVDGMLLWCVAPFFVWLAAITMLPHKEERFMYVVYPLVSCRIGTARGGCSAIAQWGGVSWQRKCRLLPACLALDSLSPVEQRA